MKFNKNVLKSKTFLLASASFVYIILKAFGFDMPETDFMNGVNVVAGLLVGLGIIKSYE